MDKKDKSGITLGFALCLIGAGLTMIASPCVGVVLILIGVILIFYILTAPEREHARRDSRVTKLGTPVAKGKKLVLQVEAVKGRQLPRNFEIAQAVMWWDITAMGILLKWPDKLDEYERMVPQTWQETRDGTIVDDWIEVVCSVGHRVDFLETLFRELGGSEPHA